MCHRWAISCTSPQTAPAGRAGSICTESAASTAVSAPRTIWGPSINTAANELDPGLTALGYGLYFSSDRPTGDSPPGESNDYNLYHTTSREVFADVETEYRPPINWAALWQAVWPNLLWALLALLLLLSLLAVLRDARRRKLGLLARCLLASLAAHVLLMFLLSFWNVTASVVSALRGRGEIRVALSPAGQGQALAAQIRGQLTEVSLPEVRQFEIARPQPTTDVQPLDARATLTVARQGMDGQRTTACRDRVPRCAGTAAGIAGAGKRG